MSEHINQLLEWQRQLNEASDDIEGADIDVAKRLLNHSIESSHKLSKLEQQRDELLYALKSARRALATASMRYSIFNDDYDRADAAIAKAESC